MMTQRDSLRSGDIWVEGSRAFLAFGDFLLPPEPLSRGDEKTNWDCRLTTMLSGHS
jgi:hypothetical protein